MGVSIRWATAQDYDDLCAIIGQVDALHRERLPHIFQEPEGPVRELDYIRDLLADENHGLLVAEVDGELVGFVHVVLRDMPPIPILVPRRVAMIDNIAVKEGFRRTGLGRALMRRAEEWSHAEGASELQLNVFEFNEPARTFYQSLGYGTISRRMGKPL